MSRSSVLAIERLVPAPAGRRSRAANGRARSNPGPAYAGGVAVALLGNFREHPAFASRVGELLERADCRVSVAAANALVRDVVRETGALDLGLHASARFGLGNVPVFDYLTTTAADVRSAILTARRFAPLIDDTLDIQLVEKEGRAVMTLRSEVTGARQITDFFVGGFYRHQVSRWVGLEPHSVEVWLSYARPETVVAHEVVFAPSPLRFSAQASGFAFDASLLEKKLINGDVRLHRLLRKYGENELERVAYRPLAGRVRRLLVDSELSGLNLRTVAARFGMSPRSFSRSLMREGTTFTVLLDDARHDQALEFIREDLMSASDLSNALGFSHVPSFQRAFRRWTGMTPGRFRLQRD